MNNYKKRFLLLLVIACFISPAVLAQVSIAPTALFFSEQNRFASLTVSNGGNEPQEISISTTFGFPTTENGSVIISQDSVMAEAKSISPHLRIFPQNFTLQGQQRQVVRFVLQPTRELDPGGYWTRVEISSSAVSPPIETTNENQIGTSINLVVNQVIFAHFRTSDANTGVDVTSVDFAANETDDVGVVAITMQQTGNAPFIGSLSFSIKDQRGREVYSTSTTNSVYTSITRTFEMDISGWQPGTYTVSGTINTERRDISSDKLLPITPVSFSEEIVLE